MKKIFILIMVLMMVVGFVGCSAQSTDIETSETEENKSTTTAVPEVEESLSEDMIKLITEQALYNEVNSKYDNADAASTRYSINKIEENGSTIYVYGSVTLYDKYGELTTGWSDNSGSYNRVFTVEIKNGRGYAEIN